MAVCGGGDGSGPFSRRKSVVVAGRGITADSDEDLHVVELAVAADVGVVVHRVVVW